MVLRLLQPLLVLSLVAPCSAQILQYADRAPDRTASVGGGLLVLFDAEAEGRWLNAVEVYGCGQGDPSLNFQLYVVDLEGRLRRRVSLPPVLLVGDDEWRMLPLPPMKVPQEFGIGLVFGTGADSRWPMEELFGQGMVQLEPMGIRYGRYIGYSSWSGIEARVGQYAPVEESHSYTWRPGTPGEGLWDREWMVRAYVSDTPDGDPEATDLIVLKTGEAFFDRVTITTSGAFDHWAYDAVQDLRATSLDRIREAADRPLDVHTAAHGSLAKEEVASIRMMAVTSPAMSDVRIVLANGRTVEGMLEAMDEETIRVRDAADRVVAIPRAEVERMEFVAMEPVAIASQIEPAVSETRRAWGPEQAIGQPDTLQGGDCRTAWATMKANEGEQWLLLTYEQPVQIAEVRVRETFNPGAVSKVTAIPAEAEEILLWEGEDPTRRAPEEFVVPVAAEVTANQIKVYLDTDRVEGWNEIDAVELVAKDGTRQWAFGAMASSSYADR